MADMVLPVPVREKKRAYEAERLVLPYLRLVPDEDPIPDPDWSCKAGQKPLKLDPGMKSTVKRLIAHLKEEKQ